jgi:DNA-binding HxlR family transcriptional regulator
LAILSDKSTVNFLRTAYEGSLRLSSYVGRLSKKQFYAKLKNLCNAGLVEKREDAYYRATTLGALVYKGHVRTLEDAQQISGN